MLCMIKERIRVLISVSWWCFLTLNFEENPQNVYEELIQASSASLYDELSLGLLAMLFAYCDKAKQILTGHVARQEQRFFHPLGEASKLKNKPNLGWGCYTWEWSKKSGYRFPIYILSLWKDQRDKLYNINRIIIIIIIIIVILLIVIVVVLIIIIIIIVVVVVVVVVIKRRGWRN